MENLTPTLISWASILEDNTRSRLSVLAQALGTPASGGEGGR